MNKAMKGIFFMLALLVLPALALADAPVLLAELPESAQMVENVEFEGGDFIQTYQLNNGATVQLLRYTGFTMTLDELISSDWPVNSGVEMQAMTEVSGYPAQHAHILQAYDESGYPVKANGGPGGVMAIDLVLVNVENTTLILQCIDKGGAGTGNAIKELLGSLQVLGGENAEVG